MAPWATAGRARTAKLATAMQIRFTKVSIPDRYNIDGRYNYALSPAKGATAIYTILTSMLIGLYFKPQPNNQKIYVGFYYKHFSV